MFKFLSNIIHAQSNARLLAAAENEFAALEAKARAIVSHATGGALTDVDKGLQYILGEISLSRGRVYHLALTNGAARKAEELAGDLLHSMHDVERKVLVILHDEVCRPLALISKEAGLKVEEVRTIVKGFVIKGLAAFGPATDVDGRPAGSGYTLTDTGADLKTRQLAANVAASAEKAKALAA